MNVVFVSNFLNHHQIPFCEKMFLLCESFKFVATEKELSVGYQRSTEAEYVIDYKKQPSLAEDLILKADAVIFGACPNNLIKLRMKENKLSFLYSERFFKKGTWRRFIPRTRRAVQERILKYKDKKLYVLCASAFLKKDLSLLGFPADKCYKWGYFPQIPQGEGKQKKQDNSILWAGRLIPLKHPEIPVLVAERLKRQGYSFSLSIAGEGPEKARISRLIEKKHLQGYVTLLGSLTHEKLMNVMGTTEIFMFTSNRREGWGAVLNEAMANGCASVCSDAIGSVPFLIEEQKTGFAFKNKSVKSAYKKIKLLLDNKALCKATGQCAKQHINALWNYGVAAKRFITLAKTLLISEDCNLFSDGPCSKS